MVENMSTNKREVLFSSLLFILGALFCLLSSAYYIFLYRIEVVLGASQYFSWTEFFQHNFSKYIVFFVICAVLLVLGLRLRIDVRAGLAKWLLASFLALYVVEIYLFLKVRIGRDTQSYIEVIKSLRQEGIDAYPAMGATIYRPAIKGKKLPIMPLTGISARPTVSNGKDYGFYPLIESDEHGFNNAKGMYRPSELDMALIGSCREEYLGMHDPYKENMGAVLRKSGHKAINLSKAGADPLMKFAALKEYTEPLRPRATLLFYHPDDALFQFKGHESYVGKDGAVIVPILRRYFDEENFSQNLILRQHEIDSLLSEVLRKRLEEADQKEAGGMTARKFIDSEFVRIWTLYRFRNKIKLDMPSLETPNIDIVEPLSSDYKKILEKSKRLVSSWDGELYLVRTPSYTRYNRYSINKNTADLRFEVVHKFATKLGIRTINLREEVFDRHPDPLSLFPFREEGVLAYLNAEFQRLAAEVVVKRLRKDGVIPHTINRD
jgi:hypothetical protein